MFTCKGVNQKMQLVPSAGTGGLYDLSVHVSWADRDEGASPITVKNDSTNTNLAAAGAADIMAAPANATTARVAGLIKVRNRHATASCTVLVRHINATSAVTHDGESFNLNPGDILILNAEGVPFVFDVNGGVKTSLTAALTTFNLAGAGTYIPSAGARAILVYYQAGGASGGGAVTGAAGNTSLGSGGGGGGWGQKLISLPSPAGYAYSVGAGGAAPAAGNNNGNDGADTTFGTLTAKGGKAGVAGGVAAATVLAIVGGLGGAAGTGGDINAPGMPGKPSLRLNGVAGGAISGEGGSTEFGGGGAALVAQGAGNAGVDTTGSGGSGAASVNGGASVAGGKGGNGTITVIEFF